MGFETKVLSAVATMTDAPSYFYCGTMCVPSYVGKDTALAIKDYLEAAIVTCRIEVTDDVDGEFLYDFV
mgnify:CR=1 FL=1